MWSTFAIVFTIGLLAGSANSIVEKLQFQTGAIGIDGIYHLFEKPWFMSLVMFVAMFLALPVYYLLLWMRKIKHDKVNKRVLFVVAIPSMFDLLGSSFQAIGLVYTPVSVFQMLKGSILIFSAALSVLFLHRKMYRHNWAGVIICVIALVFVGLSSVASRENQTQVVSLGKLLLGICFIVGGQVVCAAQYVIEEFLLKPPHDVSPVALVGLEGFWGTIFMVAVALPIVGAIHGGDVGGVIENTKDSFIMLGHSSTLMWLTISFVISVFVFNLCGVMVTATASAVHHTFLDATRTILIWIVSVIMFYAAPGEGLGEPLTAWSILQLVGFVMLIYGELLYDEVVKLPFGLHEKEPVSELLAPLNAPLVVSPAERKPAPGVPSNRERLPLTRGDVDRIAVFRGTSGLAGVGKGGISYVEACISLVVAVSYHQIFIVIYAIIACGIAALFVYVDFLNQHILMEKPFALQIYGTILGYMVVFRTNMALQRYWEGVTSIRQLMFKWSDGFSLLIAFSNATLRRQQGGAHFGKLQQRSEKFRYKIIHWFSLATALAMRALENPSGEPEDISTYIGVRYRSVGDEENEAIEMNDGNGSVKACILDYSESCSYLEVIGELTEHENATLQSADDILLVCQWITEGIMTAASEGDLLAIPPPILSRVFQETSTGMLGFNQAWKIAMVPFPFPFAQMMSLLILGIVFLMPMEISHSLDRWAPAMIFATLCVVGFTGLDRICVELEEPFGDDANDIPIQDIQRCFVRRLLEIAKSTEPERSGGPEVSTLLARDVGVGRARFTVDEDGEESEIIRELNRLIQDLCGEEYSLPSWMEHLDLLAVVEANDSGISELLGLPAMDADCELVLRRYLEKLVKAENGEPAALNDTVWVERAPLENVEDERSDAELEDFYDHDKVGLEKELK
ncbi:hypothetical protein FOL47_001501 [Perkinsus chesapeaki]|uniref:EamA domain-containing protein n=1 Tax=Perkinsus chesapeaki TaxID=330153 RepID=A0A7J6MIU7_PERCH|nr:hypothetical protein FOL47_001501 [Perkinsus chesapeaki]